MLMTEPIASRSHFSIQFDEEKEKFQVSGGNWFLANHVKKYLCLHDLGHDGRNLGQLGLDGLELRLFGNLFLCLPWSLAEFEGVFAKYMLAGQFGHGVQELLKMPWGFLREPCKDSIYTWIRIPMASRWAYHSLFSQFLHSYMCVVSNLNPQKSIKILSGWWFKTGLLWSISYMGCHPSNIFIFHFIHGIIPTPLTNSYFSRWLLHHQPAMVYHYPVETALRIHVFCQVMDTGSKWGTFKRLGGCGCGKPMGKPW